MTEELNNSEEQAKDSDKNWKEMREKLESYESKIAEFEAKERNQVFQSAGLDTTKGVGKAVEMMYEGDMTVEGIQAYASEEFGVEFGHPMAVCQKWLQRHRARHDAGESQ